MQRQFYDHRTKYFLGYILVHPLHLFIFQALLGNGATKIISQSVKPAEVQTFRGRLAKQIESHGRTYVHRHYYSYAYRGSSCALFGSPCRSSSPTLVIFTYLFMSDSM
ncbi:hypothetical protein BDQ12DRAFT_117031 [Crucibulum laeve]|uniref:Uncharacterized protein n=1 Tax=Crucibulum laeve TaxID=68775 RepID=A0A5C3M325_9AGAR|nr:hypothetical protein BDQ12DRAFT_117031 [Crucibulum laeve]